MSTTLLTVLSISFAVAAGIAVYVWASGCCTGDPLCNGAATQLSGCNWRFTVNHDSDSYGDGEIVRLYVKTGSGGWVVYQMQPNTAVQPPCKGFKYDLVLSADTDYQYYFGCQHVNGRDPDSGYYDLCLDGNCNQQPCTP